MDYLGLYKDILRMATRAFLHLALGKSSAIAMQFVDECARFRQDIRDRNLVTPLQVECAVIETGTLFQR